jgi:outer membrane protein OmpA-like peptidoglycan-associated protein
MQQAAEQTQEKGQKEAIKKADKSMDKAKSETAQNNQPEAADALKEAAEALEPTIAQLALQAKQPMPSPIAPPFNPDPKEGPRHVQVSTKVEGATTAPDKSQWNPLSKKERESLFEKYSSQLPPEYRELLRAYYEALSK